MNPPFDSDIHRCPSSSNRNDCLQFEWKLFSDQTVDVQDRVGRIQRSRENLRKQLLAQSHEVLDALAVNEDRGELDNAVEIAARATENILLKTWANCCSKLPFPTTSLFTLTDNWLATKTSRDPAEMPTCE
jgi:hypothetical protein